MGPYLQGNTPPVGAEAQETTVRKINRIIMERHDTLEGLCNRLESLADRLEPQPRPVGTDAKPATPPVANDLQGAQNRLADLGQCLDWLNLICNRLERIA